MVQPLLIFSKRIPATLNHATQKANTFWWAQPMTGCKSIHLYRQRSFSGHPYYPRPGLDIPATSGQVVSASASDITSTLSAVVTTALNPLMMRIERLKGNLLVSSVSHSPVPSRDLLKIGTWLGAFFSAFHRLMVSRSLHGKYVVGNTEISLPSLAPITVLRYAKSKHSPFVPCLNLGTCRLFLGSHASI